MKRAELLAPAGDMEKLKTAIRFGADAVYFSGNAFSLRQGAENFGEKEMMEAMDHCRSNGVKGYVTLNIYADSGDIEGIREYLKTIGRIRPHGLIISDPGILYMVRQELPDIDIHMSTQSNVTNHMAASFWYSQGARRIIAAREATLEDLREMVDKTPEDMEIEAFVHGAMCISYSGRCFLSGYMTGRDANKGQCAHPCRYKYSLVEEKRPGEYWPIEEDDRGTYIMNSRDLCMIEHIPELCESGISSLKIEGRMKSSYYVATVVRAYRAALDAYYRDPEGYRYDPSWMEELSKASHRSYTTGFYFGGDGETQDVENGGYIKEYMFLGVVEDYDPETSTALVQQRNKICLEDRVEIFGKDMGFVSQIIREMWDETTGEPIEEAPHPKQMIRIKTDAPVKAGDLIRKPEIKESEK